MWAVLTTPRIGSVIAGYLIEEEIGQGATSVVYRATHIRLGRAAALKLLTPALGDADFSDRFVRESRLAASLQHPNIVPIFDAGEEDGVLFIAMAYVPEGDLGAALREDGKLELRRALRVAAQIADALDVAHSHGLVHRDVKPANVLVTEDGRALLTDFGAVKEARAPKLTRTGGFLGTVDYAAPEQIEGAAVDARADVYSLTCVLWECLTGTPPFRRSSEFATLYAHLNDPPPDLRSRRPDLPGGLENVLSRGLAKSPVDRFASCGELVAAARLAAKPVRVHGRRLGLAAAIVAAMALAGFALGFAIDRVVTDPGMRTEVVTATVTPTTYDAHDLDAAAYALIQSGYYARARPFSESAVRALRGSGPADPYEGYANFNLGRIDVELGRCAEAVPPLKRARALQPKSVETKKLLKRARACALRH
jgi:tRNA A-37 threonylcarbamoyl transferase component Bud32